MFKICLPKGPKLVTWVIDTTKGSQENTGSNKRAYVMVRRNNACDLFLYAKLKAQS